LIDALATDRLFPLYTGSEHHQRSFTFVGDAVAGLMAGLNQHQACEGEIFNLGNPAAVTTREFIVAAEQLMGRRLRVEYRPPRSGDQASTRANISKIRRVLGFEPTTSIHDGLTQTIAAYEWDHRVH
jgi:nucleoside-diphosphate-sugar epimerase